MASRIRRRVLKAAVGGIVGFAAGVPGVVQRAAFAQPAGAGIGTRPLGGGLHVLTAAGENVLAATGPDGVVLVDGGRAADAGALLGAIDRLPAPGEVHTLFNTHWHREQTGLNERLGAAGATIIAHENTRLWLTTSIVYPWDGQRFAPLPETALPRHTFYDSGELEAGIQYGYLRHAAHTDGDLYVNFAEQDVLAVGGTLAGGQWPFVDWWTGGWIGGVVGNLELLLHLSGPGTRFVPARGPVLGRADVERHFDMYNVLYERLARMLNSGFGPEEAVAERPAADFEAEMGPSDAFVRQAFRSLWAYLSPDA